MVSVDSTAHLVNYFNLDIWSDEWQNRRSDFATHHSGSLVKFLCLC